LIKFEQVTKQYPGTDVPAVDNLNLHINQGEICILVGPSGCGKTTTMKMINRLIEPTKGKIFVNGQDISQINPIELRLNIGYVIQEIGLFPHMTIEENIATVPLEKGWDKERIKLRVDEMLNLVELDPETYRGRRPADLSGGQRQRVGVARALAADPPVMLMDEPFGALDPITRSRLQNEFLRVQEKIKKTIVFVTHDIDEAIKMGDKICVMKEGKAVQFSSPEEILSSPVNEFVENLVGGNRMLKLLNLIKCSESMHDAAKINAHAKLQEAKQVMDQQGTETIAVIDNGGHLVGWVKRKDIDGKSTGKVGDFIRPLETTVDGKTSLNDALSEMFNIGQRFVYVVDGQKRLQGLIRIKDILEAVSDSD